MSPQSRRTVESPGFSTSSSRSRQRQRTSRDTSVVYHEAGITKDGVFSLRGVLQSNRKKSALERIACNDQGDFHDQPATASPRIRVGAGSPGRGLATRRSAFGILASIRTAIG